MTSNYFRMLLLLCMVSGSTVAQSKTEREVLHLHHRKFGWLIRQRTDSLQLLLHPRLQYIHSNTWTQSYDEIFDDFKTGKVRYDRVEIASAGARAFGNTVIVTGRGLFSGQTEGRSFELSLHYTEVYYREGKRWTLVHRQATRLP